MRKRLPVTGCLLLSAVCLSSIAFAQTCWQKVYGGTDREEGRSVRQTFDGGYIVAGGIASSDSGSVYLIRTNSQGETLWTRTYGGDGFGDGYSVRQTTDGGYIIAGLLAVGYSDVYLIKTDAYGDTLWTRTYGDSLADAGFSVQQTADGGYIIAGMTRPLDSVWTADVYIIKTDAHGDTLWTRTYGGAGIDEGTTVRQTTDGGYIMTGWTRSFSAGDADVYLIRTDAQGDTLWTRTYGGTGDDGGNAVEQTADDGYIMACETYFPDSARAWLLKTDASGDTVWTRTYPGGCRAVQQTFDGGYIVAGATSSGAGDGDVYLLKTDAQGDTLWSRTFGGKGLELANSVQQTADSGYIMAGLTESFGAGFYDVYLIKTNGKLDVGPISLLSPSGVVDSGISYVPRAVVRNFGLTSGPIVQVTMNIGSAYTETVRETLVSVSLDTLVFPPWTAEPNGSLTVRCYTSLAGDQEPANDTIRDSVEVLPPPIHDVGAVAIVSPTGSVRAGDTVIPRATIRNFGNRLERFFDVRFRIGASYNEKVNVSDALSAGSTAELAFPPWVAEAGDWAVSCSTMLGSDVDSANDKISSSVVVSPQSLSIAPDQSDRIEADKSRTYQFHAMITGDTGGIVEVERPSAPTGWSVRLSDATGANNLMDTDGDGIPDLGYIAPGESGKFSLDVTAPSGTQGDTASLGQGVFLVAGHVGDRPDVADTTLLNLALVPTFSVHNFPNPFSGSTTFVVGLPEDGKANLTVYTRAGERVCRVIRNADMPAGVHFVGWDGLNDNGRAIAPGTYEYLLDYVHVGKTDRIRKRLVVTRE
jgi:hypothetical protein